MVWTLYREYHRKKTRKFRPKLEKWNPQTIIRKKSGRSVSGEWRLGIDEFLVLLDELVLLFDRFSRGW